MRGTIRTAKTLLEWWDFPPATSVISNISADIAARLFFEGQFARSRPKCGAGINARGNETNPGSVGFRLIQGVDGTVDHKYNSRLGP